MLVAWFSPAYLIIGFHYADRFASDFHRSDVQRSSKTMHVISGSWIKCNCTNATLRTVHSSCHLRLAIKPTMPSYWCSVENEFSAQQKFSYETSLCLVPTTIRKNGIYFCNINQCVVDRLMVLREYSC